MFEDLIRELKKLESKQVFSVPIESDAKGYIDKECPSEECLFKFKVHEEDWKNLFSDEAVFCPMCRHEAPSRSWFTTEQVEHSKNEALEHMQGRLHNALETGAKKFNSSFPKGGFLTMSMEVKGSKHRDFVLPAPAADEMQLEIQCMKCGARFAVIGGAYFCPCCGHSSVLRVFEDSIRKIKAKTGHLREIRKALEEIQKVDEAELTCRSLVESSIQDCVTAFQRYCEEAYLAIPSADKMPFNVFQRLKQGSNLWRKYLGEGYEEWAGECEFKKLSLLYQKRHLLAHRDGIVDKEYLDKTEDTTYKVGQRIVVTENDVDMMVELVLKLADKIKTKLHSVGITPA